MIPPFSESLRYEYDLTPDSVVIDAGGYRGDFALAITERYGCYVHVFEPVMRFANAISNRMANYPRVRVWPCALGGTDRMETFHVQNDSSGMFAGSEDTETVHVASIVDVLKWPWAEEFPRGVDLLKINTEGSEFETLEAVLDEHLAQRLKNIQVQFHTCAPDWERRYDAIAAGLSKTHELTWRTPWVWENWRRK